MDRRSMILAPLGTFMFLYSVGVRCYVMVMVLNSACTGPLPRYL